MGGFLYLSLMFLVIGACGFTRKGLPLTSTRRLTGARGRVVGGLCLAAGLLIYAFAWWFATPAERQSIRSLSMGIVLGVLGTILVLGDNLWGE